MFEWTSDLSIGMPHIDAQHQSLFRAAEDLWTAMAAGMGREMTGRILQRLIRYAREHFAAEERLMRITGYADLAPHRAEHRVFTAEILQLQERLEDQSAVVTVRTLQFLRNWLEGHIKGRDMRFASFRKFTDKCGCD